MPKLNFLSALSIAALIGSVPLASAGEAFVKDDVHPVKVKDDVHPAQITKDTRPSKQHAYDLNPNELVKSESDKRGVVINHEEQYRVHPKTR